MNNRYLLAAAILFFLLSVFPAVGRAQQPSQDSNSSMQQLANSLHIQNVNFTVANAKNPTNATSTVSQSNPVRKPFYDNGSWVGPTLGVCIGLLFLLGIPVAFAACLFFFVRSKKEKRAGWIVALVITGLLLLLWLGFFTAAIILGLKQSLSRGLTQNASQLVKGSRIFGSDYDYSFELPDANQWQVFRKSENIDTMVSRRDVYFGVNIERIPSGTLQNAYQNLQTRIRNIDPNAIFSEPNFVTIDGVTWIHSNITCVIKGMLLSYSYYVHSGDDGTFLMFGWTGNNLFAQEQANMDRIANSWQMGPQMRAAAKSAQASSSSSGGMSLQNSETFESRVKGTDYDYSIVVPDTNKWLIRRRNPSSDLSMSFRDVYVSVSVQRIDSGSNQDLYSLMTSQIRNADYDATISEAKSIMIDDVPFLNFEVTRTIDKIKYTYSYYIHSGAEGTFEVMGFTGSNIFDSEHANIDKISTSFRFGEEIKAAMKAAASHPTPTPTPTPHEVKPGAIPASFLPAAA